MSDRLRSSMDVFLMFSFHRRSNFRFSYTHCNMIFKIRVLHSFSVVCAAQPGVGCEKTLSFSLSEMSIAILPSLSY